MPSATDSLTRRGWLAAAAAAALAPPRVASARPRRAAAAAVDMPPGGTGLAPALAVVYAGQVDPAACLVSEKYDGVRAIWDGHVLRHRSGRVVAAPAGFTAALPAVPLDGELWLGRGRFEALSAIVRTAAPRERDWAAIRYMAFDLPGASGSFKERAERLAAAIAASASKQLQAAPQERIASRAALQARLEATVAAGGEGLMLHLADAPWAGGRNPALMKLKPYLDAEARVVGVRPGAGKYLGEVGALAVEAADGRRFHVGSGLSDALRHDPPPLGATITYRYRDLTWTGLPRFATYVRRYEAL